MTIGIRIWSVAKIRCNGLAVPGVPEFTSAIIDEIAGELNIDQRRIYASGISMGGGASFELAHDLGDRIAAVALVSTQRGYLLNQRLPRPTTIVWIYGSHDSSYGPEVYAVLDHLVKQNGCSDIPEVKVWTRTREDPTGITRFTYWGGKGGTEIIF